MKLPKSISYTIGFTLIICFVLVKLFSWNGPDNKGYTRIIESDGKGYYMYLPNIFIKRNISEQVADARFIFNTPGGTVNKYYSGTALAMLPFFTIGYSASALCNQTTDGYSEYSQKAISIAGLFYLVLGLLFLSRFLLLYNIQEKLVCLTLLLIVFGTNLLMYAVYHPSFSHIYSFAFVAMFLYHCKQFIETKIKKNILLSAFAFGMIVLIRPSNGIILFSIPFLAGSASELRSFIKAALSLKMALPAFLIIADLLAIQIVLWYVQTGHFLIWSYQNEGFYFSQPQLYNVLLSFRKGFFIYTPLALLSFGGLYVLYKSNRYAFYWLSFFFVILICITASWWCWYYGPSFGQRSFVEFYPLNALLLALLFQHVLQNTIYKMLIALSLVCVSLNLIQSFQYVKGILSSWDMSFEKYKYVFLRTSENYYSCLGGCYDIQPYSRKKTLLLNESNNYEAYSGLWSVGITQKNKDEHNVVADYTGKEFNTTLEYKATAEATNCRLLYAEIELERMEFNPSGKNGPSIVCSINTPTNDCYHYYSFGLNLVPNTVSAEWKKQTYTVELPKMRAPGDVLKIYVWNQHKQDFCIDNFKVKLYGLD